MTTQAWAVVLHNSRLGAAFPDTTLHNALGDRLRHALCPANPEARRYAVGLAADLASRGVATVHLEALTAGGFDHGETHERGLIYLGETARFLLGLCFCVHCRAAGRAAGIDVETLVGRVRRLLERVLDSHEYAASLPALSPDVLADLLGDTATDYLRVRAETVTSLAAEVAAAVREVSSTTRVVLLDPSGAALGYATGRPGTDEPATALAWREGLDLAGLAQHVDIGALCYFADPDRIRSELAHYAALLPKRSSLAAILRPTWPDVTSAEELVRALRAVIAGGADELHFYTYGLLRLESFRWIEHSLPSITTMKGTLT